ncbi:uncharacterized protein AB9W97_000128 isoform 2-T2 [Spinachia spinachia]
MLVPALLRTSLLLWLARQTLQGGVRPQSVSWGQGLPARGGIQPGAAGALGAMGNRYGTKAMKTGVGRYSGAQLGVGGYRSYGLGSRAGLRQGGYGAHGAYGAALGTGMGTGMGTGHTNGLAYGHGGKRYGAGHGSLPGYGASAGNGHHGTRPGVSAADLGGPQMADLGQASRDLKREKSRAIGPSYGDRTQAGMATMRRSDIPTDAYMREQTGFRPAALPHARESKSMDLLGKSSSLRPLTPLDKQSKGLAASQAHGGESYDPAALERRRAGDRAAALAATGVRQRPNARDYDSTVQQNQQAPNCGSTRDLLDLLGIPHQEDLGSETQRTRGPALQPQVDKDGNSLATPQAQGEGTHRRPVSQAGDGRGHLLPLPRGQGTDSYLSAVAEGLGRGARDKSGPRIRGSVAVDRGHDPLQGGGSHAPVIPGERGTQSLGIAAVGGREAKSFTPDGQKVKHLSLAEREVTGSKAGIPGQTSKSSALSSCTPVILSFIL